jgi:hypothetical protein
MPEFEFKWLSMIRLITTGHAKPATRKSVMVNYEQRIEEATWSGD